MTEFTPPVLEGIAVMLYNLFVFFPKESACLLSDDYNKRKSAKDPNMRLPFRHYICRVPNFSFSFVRSANFRAFLQYCWIPVILARGIAIVLKENVGSIFSLNSRGPYFVAAYYLSRITRKPLYVFMFDFWSRHLLNTFQKKMAQKFEKKILQAAAKIFAMSDNLKDYYKKEYGVDCVLFNHSYIKEESESFKRFVPETGRKEFFEIAFTGVAVGTLWVPMLQEAIRELPGEKIRLRLCVPYINEMGINDENVIVESLNRQEVLQVQKDADVLVLTTFWGQDYSREVIETSSPSKLGEYLMSKVPILVWAPEYAYISQYAARGRWGLVVNKFDKEEIKKAILKLKNDAQLRRELVTNALRVAINHDARIQSVMVQKYIFG